MTPAKQFDLQLHFWCRLKKLGVFVCFTGVMDIPQRWEVIRRAIIGADLAQSLSGRTETFEKAFTRAAKQPLFLEAA